MKIKTYVVDNLAEAYPLIFRDLGKEAIILKSKPTKAPGFFGVFRRRKLEVVAAAELSEQAQVSPTAVDMSASVAANPLINEGNQAEHLSSTNASQDVLLKELAEMKGLIQSMTKASVQSQTIPKPLEGWVAHLRDQEVDEEVIQFIVKKFAMGNQPVEEMSNEEVQETLLHIIEQLFDEGIAKETEPNASFITLVGPTGVGKTTTIAKLAAARVLHGKQRVGLLTTDTYRIAAVEQLKTYGNILNVPLEVVASPEDLPAATENLKGCKVFFMDSAGRNYLEEGYVQEISDFLGYDAEQENYLVLSMTTRWRDMKKITEKMKAVPIDKLILTKWDETTCYGPALNMVYHYPYPLTYLCTGQGVPQDIIHANPAEMAKKLVGVER
ncbi:flagellar biosynthesis protein FlhF [Bacillus sp. B15-48]|uniref:flagellar biosynthesis protein FlhF n=1 Tax=Bacillus sp. B15-48 TaxID=1548601 RepID=UPI00193EDB9D|nr:flagellar biosynthesis protein FlhF [Bacillus sp. B15-48]MBM4764149.1 flagellar biosynthesis protein FlhF [Bacillus sp. B15-48]